MSLKRIIKEEVESFLNENTYEVYHGTNEKFSNFSLNRATQGIIWFTDSIQSIKDGEHGGQGGKIIMKRYITLNNPAGWDEYEKLGLGQIKDRGYDGVILPQGNGVNDYIVFSPKSISAKPPAVTEYSDQPDVINPDDDTELTTAPMATFGDHLKSISEETGTKVLMPNVSESDADKLIEWWNANTNYYHFKVKRPVGNMFDVVRQTP